MRRPDHLAETSQFSRHEVGAAAHGHQRERCAGRLHPLAQHFDPLVDPSDRGLADPVPHPAQQRRVAEAVQPSHRQRHIGQRQRGAAHAHRIADDPVAHRVGTDGHTAAVGFALVAHDGAAAEAHRDQVGHAEVGTHTADFDRSRGFTGEAVHKDADVSRRAADIDHEPIGQPGQRTRTAHRIRRSRAHGEHRVAVGFLHRHQRPVVLGQEALDVESQVGERVTEAVHDPPRDGQQRRVEDGGVLAFEQS